MGLGKFINKLTDQSATGVAVVGLALAPFTGGSSFLLSIQVIGASKMIAYGVSSIEETFSSKKQN